MKSTGAPTDKSLRETLYLNAIKLHDEMMEREFKRFERLDKKAAGVVRTQSPSIAVRKTAS
ncbi:hypothetical protein [Bradyrhizobium sp. LTSP849]|uniref:hypothetical protein n=1 Tax=Bradyrhizobium sp. LTSP849 TaxID=1615890 RepID=UPI000B14D143|nr:hypothetical protein [Bradyrhizobium sp. LTSP849]